MVSSVAKVVENRSSRCFTDGHAAEICSAFYNKVDHLIQIDWHMIDSWSWCNKEDDNDRKRRKQAEFLVKEHCPWPLIEISFDSVPDVKVLLYPPQKATSAATMINRTKRPHMTYTRAIVLKLLQQYCILGYELTLLEVHKLLYFLQEFGEPLSLKFQRKYYGPYADNLRYVLNNFEGHFTQGFADGQDKPNIPIEILPGAIEESDHFLSSNDEQNNEHMKRFALVEKLIEGFESPYGMELLSTVHWLVYHEYINLDSQDSLIEEVKKWSPRKAKLIQPEHIGIARKRLLEIRDSLYVHK